MVSARTEGKRGFGDDYGPNGVYPSRRIAVLACSLVKVSGGRVSGDVVCR